MRVLYVIDSLINAGAETSLAHMAPGYRDLGIDLHVGFLKSRWHLAADLIAAGVTLHPVALDAGRPRQLIELIRLIRRLEPDVVHTTLYEADVLGRTAATLTRTPVVTTLANSAYSAAQFSDPSARRWKLRAAQAVDAVTCRFAHRFQAVSSSVAADMTARLRIPASRIVVIPRARQREVLGEPSAERRSAVRRRLGIADDTPVILAIARHEHQKGLDVLLEAIPAVGRDVPDAVVLVAGREGRETANLSAFIQNHDLEPVAQLLGARDDVADLVVAADVVAVPSRYEGMPGAVLEAMALQRPVVASDIPMVREVIGSLAYALVPVEDAPALAAALERCINDPGREANARAARERFDGMFTPSAVVAQLHDLYADVMSGPR